MKEKNNKKKKNSKKIFSHVIKNANSKCIKKYS